MRLGRGQAEDAHEREVREERLEGRDALDRIDQLAVLVVGGIEVLVLAEVVAGALNDADLGLGDSPARLESERDRDCAEHHQREESHAQPGGTPQMETVQSEGEQCAQCVRCGRQVAPLPLGTLARRDAQTEGEDGRETIEKGVAAETRERPPPRQEAGARESDPRQHWANCTQSCNFHPAFVVSSRALARRSGAYVTGGIFERKKCSMICTHSLVRSFKSMCDVPGTIASCPSG